MNSGVTLTGSIILADINALTFSKSEVLELIRNQVWLDKHSYKYLDDLELKKYFSKIVCEKLTKENLDKYWRNG